MISFKEFLTEGVVKPWKVADVPADHLNQIDKLYKTIVKANPKFDEMLQNGSILYRGWAVRYTGNNEHSRTLILDSSKSKRTSRDTNNFYQMCMDYSPYLKDFPSRSNSIIAATHQDAAGVHGSVCAIIPFANTKLALHDGEDIFFAKIKGHGFEVIGDFVESYCGDNLHKIKIPFTVSQIPKLKEIIEKISDDEDGAVSYIFSQFGKNKFDSFINKYFTPKTLGLKLFNVGDKLPIANNPKKGMTGTMSNGNRYRGNEVWFSGKAFSIDENTWAMLLDYVKKTKNLHIHRNSIIK